jgi:hypothetical protein
MFQHKNKTKEKTLNNTLVENESDHFALVMKQAEMLANANIIPKAYQKKPADIVAAGLAGRAYGWDVMIAMRNFHVIEGTASLRPEALLGLVRQAGHSVLIEVNGNKATATGKRYDNGDTHTAEFTTHDAETAGLLQKRNWKQYGDAMLTWRAVSILCRVLFPDVVLGAGYVPEELGVEDTNHEGEIIEIDFMKDAEVAGVIELPKKLLVETDELKELIDELIEVDRALLKEWWKTENLPSLTSNELTEEDVKRITKHIKQLQNEEAF